MQKKQPSTKCRACGTINISNYVNNFKHKPYNSHFEFTRKRIFITNPKLDFYLFIFFIFYFIYFFFWPVEGGGGSDGGIGGLTGKK